MEVAAMFLGGTKRTVCSGCGQPFYNGTAYCKKDFIKEFFFAYENAGFREDSNEYFHFREAMIMASQFLPEDITEEIYEVIHELVEMAEDEGLEYNNKLLDIEVWKGN